MANTARKEQIGPTTAYTAPEDAPQREESVRVYGLVKHLVDDLALLFRKELALAGSEVSRSVDDSKKGITGLVGGAVILNSGYIFLLAAAVLGLAQVMPAWAASLIVGGVATLIGLVMVQQGKKKLEPSSFKPERTMDELRKDKDTVKGVSS